ncbi:carboxylesterase [Xylariomycetidae sp. FL0641]|nr:carboxylesterase [Xylariomycetidae sp. FL0641]
MWTSKLWSAAFAAALVPQTLGMVIPHAPVVDLEYAMYQGYYNSTYGLNNYNGIRYAAAPVGKLRWQPPQAPEPDRSQIFQAVEYGPQCPQSGAAPGPPSNTTTGDEDCLLLNVQAPANKTNLPVLVWIHGGGYGAGNARFDFSTQLRTNGNAYVAVAIQYRLGAFGFLSSAELAGVPNAALLDMRFALRWVQRHVHRFGGDPARVTIAGESAGAGAVMLLAMAYGGEDEHLFDNVIASSPYLPTQWDFDGEWPEKYYRQFVAQAGCANSSTSSSSSSSSAFDCLVAADTATLQIASDHVSTTGALYGQWAFIPVTDGRVIRSLPSAQLHRRGAVNGRRALAASNANEGFLFTPQNITTEADFAAFVRRNYPRLTPRQLGRVLDAYRLPPGNASAELEYVDSNGLTPPFATQASALAVGWQQAAENLYAETTFVCPSYWLADAFSSSSPSSAPTTTNSSSSSSSTTHHHRQQKEDSLDENKNNTSKAAWKYQFSPPPATHGMDLLALALAPGGGGATTTSRGFDAAAQRIWGNFVVRGDPRLGAAQVAASSGEDVAAAQSGRWGQWRGTPRGGDAMLNLNVTGGAPVATRAETLGGEAVDTTVYEGARARFTVVEGWSWEAGRGDRCRLWVDVGVEARE